MPRLLHARLAALALLCAPLLPGRPPEYSLREWHGDNGLPNELVHDVAQDSDGYLWVATEDGLARFNGIRFDQSYPLAEGAPRPSGVLAIIKHPTHGLIFSDKTGQKWRWAGGQLRQDAITRTISPRPVAATLLQPDGTYWVGFHDGRIERVKDGVVSEVALDGVQPFRRPISLANDGEGGVWIAAGTKLFRHRDGKTTAAPGWPGDEELRIGSSRRGKPWIVTRTVVGRWNGTAVEAGVSVPELYSAHFVRDLLEDRDGFLWVATRSQGAYVVTEEGYQVVPTSHRTVSSICQDTQGNIWLATGGGGLARLQPRRFRLFDAKAGLRDDVTFSVCEDALGRIWFANRDGGAARLVNGKLEIMDDLPEWPETNAGRVVPTPDGGIWFSGSTGLLRVEADGRTVRRIRPTPFRAIRILFGSRSGQLWVAGDAGELGRLDATGFTRFGTGEGFPTEPVTCIDEDATGRIIAGSGNGNLFRLEGAQFQPLRIAGGEPLASIRMAAPQSDGTLWVVTGGSGLHVIADGKNHRLGKAQGMPDDLISQLLFDDHGRVWFGSDHGIFSVERREIMDFVAGRTKKIHAMPFGQNEGLEHISCLDGFRPNSWKGRDGTLWFTTRRGVLAIDPHVVRTTETPPVFIDELRIDDAPQPLAAAGGLRSTARKIEVRFSVLNFTSPERTPVRYRLEGFDQDWTVARAERSVTYPSLGPANYRFRVEAADSENSWGGPGASLALAVVPFWWQTVWFWSLAALVVLALLIVAVRAWSHRRLRSRLERLERESAVDRERTRIARDIHDELGASLTRISFLAQGAPTAGNTEGQRSYFEQIYTTATTITRSIDAIVWALDARHDNLDSLEFYLGNYAQSFLGVAKVRCRLNAPQPLPHVAVSSQVRHHLFVAFKEALNNCVKHAHAAEVVIDINYNGENLVVTITDDGRGLPSAGEPAPAPTAARVSTGHGLANIVQRLTSIGGEARVRGAKSGGTEVILAVPLGKALA